MHNHRPAPLRAEQAGKRNGFGIPLVESAFTHGEALQLAQAVVNEKKLSGPEELRKADREVHDLAAETGALAELVFFGERNSGDGGSGRPAPRPDAEGEMFRRICSECFRMSGGNPFVGGRRATVEQLRSAITKRLKGREHKLFDKCWSRMAAEGAIVFNSNSTAASLNPFAEGVRDGRIKEALRWAIREQANANPEWRAKCGSP
ncbi:MAG: hypothetical protein AB1324_00100 [Candidatus Micrarchaeota archaeon]